MDYVELSMVVTIHMDDAATLEPTIYVTSVNTILENITKVEATSSSQLS